MNLHRFFVSGAAWALVHAAVVFSADAAVLPGVAGVEMQPLASQVRRLIEATDYLGSPFSDAEKKALNAAIDLPDAAAASAKLQEILDARCLFGVNINPEMRVKVAQGPARPELLESGWRQFLVKVHNESGTTAALKAVSPNAGRLHNSLAPDVPNRWLDMQMFDAQPLKPTLGGDRKSTRLNSSH